MPNVKISELPVASGVTPDDLFVIVDDPAGTPVTKRVAASAILAEPEEQLNPPGMARLVTVQDSGTFEVDDVRSTTGYVAVRWWDGSVQVFGSGNPVEPVSVSKSVPSSGNWSKSAPKEIFIWSCTAGNATQSGDLTRISNGFDYANGIASLSASGLTALAYIDLMQTGKLTSVNVSGCTALTYLRCYECYLLSSLNISGCTALTLLDVGSTSLTSLNVSGLTALNWLRATNTALTSLNVSGLTALTTLQCYGCTSLTSLNVSGCTALATLYCSGTALTSLNVSGFAALTEFICGGTALTSLNFIGCTALAVLSVYDSGLTSLNLSGLTSLTQAGIGYNPSLTSLNVSGCTALVDLWCFDNALTSLNVSGCTALATLECGENELTSLDLSGLSSLQGVGARRNNLTSIRAVGVMPADGPQYNLGYYGYFLSSPPYYAVPYANFALNGNNLSAAALNQFYTDLGAVSFPATIAVNNNPGAASDDPTIATAKGYTVYGS